MRLWYLALVLLSAILLSGCVTAPEKLGLAYAGSVRADNVELLVDETWADAEGARHVDQEIFASIFGMIDDAGEFILLDMFLLNDFGYVPGSCIRPLSQELTDRLIAKRTSNPEVPIIFITDPINNVYSSVESPQFNAMEAAGVQVVWTDLNPLRDSNPYYSKPWRVLVKPFGVGPGKTSKNPLGDGRISLRSKLKLLNFKANHRKLIVTEKSLLVTSANPHSASSAHWNMGLRVDGAGTELGVKAESAVLRFSDAVGAMSMLPASVKAIDPGQKVGTAVPAVRGALREHALPTVELLTEIRIRDKVLELLDQAAPGSRIDLCMFYLSEKTVVKAFIRAQERGCNVRVILDPSKDSFGRTKNGIPNRQSAAKLVKGGIPLRWTETHGEQCHVKMLYVEHADGTATLLQGSCNFTRRNLNNFNCEADLAYTAPMDAPAMVRVREVFDRWWKNGGDRIYTTEYSTYEDPSRWRKFSAWWKETAGMGTF